MQLLEFGAGAYSTDDEDVEELEEPMSMKKKRMLYDEEQAANRDDLLQALEDGVEEKEGNESFGGLIKVDKPEIITDPTPEEKEAREKAKKVGV